MSSRYKIITLKFANMIDKKTIYLGLHKLSREDIKNVYAYLKSKGEPIACDYTGNRYLSYITNPVKGWNDFREVYRKAEITLDKFYDIFRKRIEFAYFADMDMFNEWYNEDKIEIISMTYEFQCERHLVYYKEKAS